MTKERSKHLLYISPRSLGLTCERLLEEKNKLLSNATIAATLDISIKFSTVKKVRSIILNPKKAPGYDLITNYILQKLPVIRIYHQTL